MIFHNKLDRAVSVDELLKMKFKVMKFNGEFKDLLGTPEKAGTWIIWGKSGNGKTRFTLKLAKYLTNFGKVVYNTLEEGTKLSFQRAVAETDMQSCGNKFLIVSEPITNLSARLSRQRAPRIAIIDSLQYVKLNKTSYINLVEKHPNVLFIFISHAEGKNPKGTTADAVRYHSDVKIHVEGYKAFATSRYGGGQPFTIWEEGAANYWGNGQENENHISDN